ncbi:MAG: hypothetical protein SFV51_13010 [Bryobacteraceae bacterium]|nr:hypothetical protein [Bryobacteraceae bacterium]
MINSAIRKLALSSMFLAGSAGLFLATEVQPAYAGSGGNELRIQTRLTGGALNGMTPSGSSRFRARGGNSDFSVEVEDVNLPDGTLLTVTVGGRAAGSIRLALRGGEIDVNTRDGDSVPQAAAGEVVVVSGPSGAILSGALR